MIRVLRALFWSTVLIVFTAVGIPQERKVPSEIWEKAGQKNFVRVLVTLNVPTAGGKRLTKEESLV